MPAVAYFVVAVVGQREILGNRDLQPAAQQAQVKAGAEQPEMGQQWHTRGLDACATHAMYTRHTDRGSGAGGGCPDEVRLELGGVEGVPGRHLGADAVFGGLRGHRHCAGQQQCASSKQHNRDPAHCHRV